MNISNILRIDHRPLKVQLAYVPDDKKGKDAGGGLIALERAHASFKFNSRDDRDFHKQPSPLCYI